MREGLAGGANFGGCMSCCPPQKFKQSRCLSSHVLLMSYSVPVSVVLVGLGSLIPVESGAPVSNKCPFCHLMLELGDIMTHGDDIIS